MFVRSDSTMDKTKEWEMEMLMEKLRAKSGQFKSFLESAKEMCIRDRA